MFGFCSGLHNYSAYSISLVYRSDHHANRLHGVEAAAIVGPEDPILVLAPVDASSVPDTVKIGLAASIVPPASLIEMGTIACCGEDS